MPWMNETSTVANLQCLGHSLVKQIFTRSCRRWIKQETSKAMVNSMENVKNSLKKFEENWREMVNFLFGSEK
jgi:hypothetical protein